MHLSNYLLVFADNVCTLALLSVQNSNRQTKHLVLSSSRNKKSGNQSITDLVHARQHSGLILSGSPDANLSYSLSRLAEEPVRAIVHSCSPGTFSFQSAGFPSTLPALPAFTTTISKTFPASFPAAILFADTDSGRSR